MTVRKGFMLCPTGRGLAATRRPFGDAHLPVWHSTRTRISSLYQTTQHKNKVSTLSGDLTVKNKYPLYTYNRITVREAHFSLPMSHTYDSPLVTPMTHP
jgi:hypothetical protein